jgi:serine/threonine protein kinase
MRNWNRYEHLTIIGRGGQGEVWKALDTWTKEVVAIKYLLDKSPAGMALFEKDIRERSTNPHHIAIKEYNLNCKNPHFVMEYCQAGTLASKILKCSTKEIVIIMRAMIIALKPLHDVGGFHGDFKPHNIMLADALNGKTPKLTDFGLAHVPNIGSMMTWTPRGTDPYKAPEVRQKLAYSSKADIYSFGITIFELLTGNPSIPFLLLTPGPTKLVNLLRQMTHNLPQYRPDLDAMSRQLDEIEEELNKDGLEGFWASLSYPGFTVGAAGVALILTGLFGGKK